jgi:excisionase family DNA binding protein
MKPCVQEPASPLLVSLSEAARLLGLSPFTVRDWCLSKKIASHKVFGRRMISRTEINRILSESLRPRQEEAHPQDLTSQEAR